MNTGKLFYLYSCKAHWWWSQERPKLAGAF